MKTVTAALVAAVGAMSSGAVSAAKPPNGEELLARMTAGYAGLATYQGAGVQRTVYVSKDGTRRTTELRFKIAFVRPDRFRFEFDERECCGGRYIIWADKNDVRTWWQIRPGVERPPSLGHALGAAAGVSGATSMIVPTYLLPEQAPGAYEGGAKLIVYQDPVRVRRENVSGTACDVMRVKMHGDEVLIWLAQNTHLIRRMFKHHEFDDFATDETTTYDFTQDAPIDAALAFDPPSAPATKRSGL